MLKSGIIILIITVDLLFGDYFISFDFTSKNGVLTSYNFNCSKSMTSSDNFSKLLFTIKTSYKNVKDICKYNQKEIINNLLKFEFFISGYDKKNLDLVYSKTKGVFLPVRFDIIIRDKKAYFYIKEND